MGGVIDRGNCMCRVHCCRFSGFNERVMFPIPDRWHAMMTGCWHSGPCAFVVARHSCVRNLYAVLKCLVGFSKFLLGFVGSLETIGHACTLLGACRRLHSSGLMKGCGLKDCVRGL